ncbi:hypothetical protein AN216_04395 [Streptomyces oceani]|uniref:Uncharacterized protein n=2 Tax=Streptomyces oceani TaxID=1075402 RepID=A0A1E7KMI4_9ACTN|nr:hypothetical protein AN216_04395 [Streptomyces oceani]
MLDPDLCLDVPEDFDDSDAEPQVHPIGRKLFQGTTAAEAFRKAHEWVAGHDLLVQDVSWDYLYGNDEPHTLSLYFVFDLDPEDAEDA